MMHRSIDQNIRDNILNMEEKLGLITAIDLSRDTMKRRMHMIGLEERVICVPEKAPNIKTQEDKRLAYLPENPCLMFAH